MSNYGWTNEDGEPIMSGEAWRFEQQLDMDSQADYYADHFYDDEPEGDEEICNGCGEWESDCICDDVADEAEDAWLDGSYEE